MSEQMRRRRPRDHLFIRNGVSGTCNEQVFSRVENKDIGTLSAREKNTNVCLSSAAQRTQKEK